MSSTGVLFMVNESFAMSLGYDSIGDVLTDKANLLEFMPTPQEGVELLRLLRDIPGVKHEALLSINGGGVKAFWIMSIAGQPREERAELSCFLLERSTDVLLSHCHREYADVVDKHSSVSIFLASTARLFQRYMLGERRAGHTARSMENRKEGAGNKCANLLTPLLGKDANPSERRQSAFLLKTVFDDIYQIAIDEAELKSINIAPVNMHLLLEQLYSQAFPEMTTRNVCLHTSLETQSRQLFSCSASLLRHAFLRSLLVLTQGVNGGTAHVKISRVDAGGDNDDIFILRSVVSWEAEAKDPAKTEDTAEKVTAKPLMASRSSIKGIEMNAVSYTDELKIIDFLVGKSCGVLIPGVYTESSRSLQIDLFFQSVDDELARLCMQVGYCPSLKDTVHEYMGVLADSTMTSTEIHAPSGENSKEEHLAAIDLINADDLLGDEAVFDNVQATKGMDILIVEDSLNSRMLFSRFLRGTNHRVTEAENGLVGVELVRKKAFDIIFMDMEMPLLDGYQATKIIRALETDEHREHTPIIAQTAHVLPEYRQKCIEAGCTEVLSKPFSRNSLLAILNSLAQTKTSSLYNSKLKE